MSDRGFYGASFTNKHTRQHLYRRHSISFRCKRCWASFDSQLQLTEHSQKRICESREKPLNERFMDGPCEQELERSFRKMADADVWWALFKLLVKEIQSIDDITLRCVYSPC